MKRDFLETRRQVMSCVVTEFAGGRESAAARLGLPLKKLDNHMYENAGSQPLTDQQLHLLESANGTSHLPDYICALYGGMFVPTPAADQLDNVELYSRSLNTAALRGAVDQLINECLADGQISKKEADKILEASRRHIAARLTEVNAVITLHGAQQ